tara:strand:+ start:750 stop:950 length:201 start_codon:yes stop_codon:yes gene_type:complete
MGIFILGSMVFIVAFIFFKISALKKTKNNQSWSRLALVGLVDYLALIIGSLGTGILFMTIYSIGHG